MPSPGNSPLDRSGDRRGTSRERDSRRLDSTDDRGGVEYPPRPSSRNQMERRDRGREVTEDSLYWDRRQRDEGGPREDGRPRDDGRRYIDDGRRPGDRGPDRGMDGRGADRAFDRRPDRGGRASGRDGPESSRHEAGSGRGRDGPESGRYDGGSGRAGVQPAAAASGPGMAGRQPSSRSGRHSRGHTPPATNREWNSAGGSERGTPVQAAPAPRRTGGTPLGGSSLLAELIQAGKQKQQQETAPGSEEDAEAGEILPDAEERPAAGARKRKHSPIVWDGGASKQARGGPGLSGLAPGPAAGESLLERTQREALALRLMDIDPDAPAAMKASPSLSFDGDQEDAGGASKDDSQEGHANGYASVQPAKGKSRWAMLQEEEDEEEGGGGPATSGLADAAAAGAGSASPAGIEGPGAEGAQGPSSHRGAAGFGSDSDVEDGGREKAAPAEMLYDMRKGCRDVHDFERIEKISEGAYGVVYKAREKSTGRIVALKRIKMERQTEGFPVTSVREINILLNFHHPNIVRVEEVVVSPRQADQIFMVMEYMDHDLKSLMDDKKRYSQPFSTGQVKCLMQQLLAGVAFLHHHWVLHRDLKTSNILYNGHGDLKLCDFGMARQYGEPLGNYTTLVVTLWYRAPELLFGAKKYSTAVDMWSVGCIMGEILTGKPLLPGQGEFDQIDKMVQLLGNPTTEEWPGLEQLPEFKKISLKKVPSQLRQRFTASTGFVGGGTSLTESGLDLLARLLQWNPDKRISAADALNHPWFSEAPKPVARVLMPTFAPRKAS